MASTPSPIFKRFQIIEVQAFQPRHPGDERDALITDVRATELEVPLIGKISHGSHAAVWKQCPFISSVTGFPFLPGAASLRP